MVLVNLATNNAATPPTRMLRRHSILTEPVPTGDQHDKELKLFQSYFNSFKIMEWEELVSLGFSNDPETIKKLNNHLIVAEFEKYTKPNGEASSSGGSCSVVYAKQDCRDAKVAPPDGLRMVAIKRISFRNLIHLQQAVNEMKVLGALQGRVPRITTLYEVRVDEKREYVYLIMKMEEGMDLFNDIFLVRQPFKPKSVVIRMVDLALIFYFLKKNAVIYNDLKLENIIITPDSVKVIDFGLAKKLKNVHDEINIASGTLEYLAPEKFAADPKSGVQGDIFSLGIIYYCLAAYRPSPFTHYCNEKCPRNKFHVLQEIANSILNMDTNKLLTDTFGNTELTSLLNQMMNRDKQKRLTIEQIIVHPFFLNSGVDFVQRLRSSGLEDPALINEFSRWWNSAKTPTAKKTLPRSTTSASQPGVKVN